jgi:hypothetical protein
LNISTKKLKKAVKEEGRRRNNGKHAHAMSKVDNQGFHIARPLPILEGIMRKGGT